MLKYIQRFNSETGEEWIETELRGKTLLNYPLLNKGTAFSQEERESLGLIGKLPYQIESLEQQVARARYQYKRYPSVLQRHIYLNNLHEKNEVVFYKLCQEDLDIILPMIYTPGVGSAVIEFSHEFRQPRGLYLAYPDYDKMEHIFENRTHPEIDVLVVTDGEGVLGIGDQGIGGMDIPIAKLIVYTLCGLNPYRTIPIMLDVGTNNQALLNDPMYLGWRHKRIQGEEYDAFIDRFVTLVSKKFPNAFLHWEDFGRENAAKVLHKYQDKHVSFNDDMQGTGVVSLAALLSAITTTQVPLTEQRVVIFGGGSAGIGIADQLYDAMLRAGLSEQEARKRFWIIDRNGLLLEMDSGLNKYQKPYARSLNDVLLWPNQDSFHLLQVVEAIHPTILIGCSTVRAAFTQEVIEAMAKHVARPIVFPLSNPTQNCEAEPADILQWTQGRALMATGSPFDAVNFNGTMVPVAQCNNALSFPGIGLGVVAVRAQKVTSNMLWAASLALSELAPIHKDPFGPLLPRLNNMQEIAIYIGEKVAEQAVLDGVAIKPNVSYAELIRSIIWQPYYRSIKPRQTDS